MRPSEYLAREMKDRAEHKHGIQIIAGWLELIASLGECEVVAQSAGYCRRCRSDGAVMVAHPDGDASYDACPDCEDER